MFCWGLENCRQGKHSKGEPDFRMIITFMVFFGTAPFELRSYLNKLSYVAEFDLDFKLIDWTLLYGNEIQRKFLKF